MNGDPADDDGSDDTRAAEAIDPGFTMQVPAGDPDPGFSAGPSRKSIFDGLPQQLPGSSLHLLMEPQDIASVPGLPAHVYKSADVTAPVRATKHPSGYASTLDQVSLAQPDFNATGLDLSNSAPSAASNSRDDRLQQGAKAANILGWTNTGWDAGNRIAGAALGVKVIGVLDKTSKWAGRGIEPAKNLLEAQHEIAGGAEKSAAYTGAEAGSALVGELLMPVVPPCGGVAGAVLGGVAGGLAPDFLFGNMTHAQVGKMMMRPRTGYPYGDASATTP